MKVKNYFLLLFVAMFSSIMNAQETTPNVPSHANHSETVVPEYVSSIASRLSEIPAFVDVVKEAQDKRSLGNTVIIGKDRQTQDDYFVRNRHESEQSVRVMPPSVVFDAYTSGSQPTDPSVAIGPDHVFVVFNTGFAIYDKSGTLLAGPMAPNPAIFPNSGCCDLTVSYDAAVDRWVVTFLGSGAQVAVSDGPDPINDGWYNYNISAINDYQKLSVWSDGYYLTDNTGSSNKVWAMERTEMLAGNAAQILGFNLPGIATNGFYSPQALNVSDANMPAAGGATFIYLQDNVWGGVTTDHVKLWTLDIDWTAGNGTMSAATELPATPFISVFDGGSFSNLTQPGGGPAVDALQATIMNQAQFRKFAGHNSAIFNFVVDTDAGGGELAGVRWFELRQTADNQPWTVFQEGTYTAPDGRHAWHASMIMDGAGNIGMGYTSMAGPTTANPTDFRISSYYTGRFDGDASGAMTVAEELISAGNSNIPGTRYGDYSKIDIDPSDDSTFWFINEYMNSGRKGVVGAFQLQAPGPDDIGVLAITAPNSGVLTAAEDIVINIRNFGDNDITNPEVQYTIDGGSPVVDNYSGTIAAGTTESFTFGTPADLSTSGATYIITARTNLAGDTNPGNDEKTKEVTNAVLYCTATATLGCNLDGIKRFVLNTIDADDGENGCNTEPASSPVGYADRTNLSTILSNETGSNVYLLQARTNWADGVDVEALSAWIDFNDDGVFEVSERLISGDFFSVVNALEDFALVIPVGAAAGSHRLRVKAIDTSGGGDILDPCADHSYGEVQDYTVVIGTLGVQDPTITEAEFIIVSGPNNQFDITLTTAFEGVASIAIYNVLGQALAFNNLEKEGNSYTYHLDMSYADSGVYFIKMGDTNSKTFKTGKIIVR